ncbi:keratin-associated protein 5-8 [Drosophila biarmipes]|uniref:keratin-associated protein 5-8 n=1 Tax=Drosophila biarmipes TaxID=125945 RepID=UPI0007E60260|nr:keratin-associated protein 5-8 [Drosophila biarmipes]XP_016947292.1 keratin-associated protein 5-8 [Drosophila biarmipes]
MCSCGQFNPFYIGPYPECACGDCPYGKYSGFTRCGWSGGNGPFGTTFGDRCCGDSRYGGGGGGPSWNPFCAPSHGSSFGSSSCGPRRAQPSCRSPCQADCCMMCPSRVGCCGQSCGTSCCSCF